MGDRRSPLQWRINGAIAYFKKNKKDGVQIILKKMCMSPEQAKYAERTYDQYDNTYFERVPYPSTSGIRTALDSLVKENPKAKSADPSAFEDSGFIKSLYD